MRSAGGSRSRPTTRTSRRAMTSPPAAGSIPWIRVSDAPGRIGETIEVRGWLTHRRSRGKVQFLMLRDGSGVIQCVAGIHDLTPAEWEDCARLTQESAVIVSGALRADARSPGGVELGLSMVRVLSIAETYPISP